MIPSFRRAAFIMFTLFLLLFSASACEGATVYFVTKKGGEKGCDGASWERALDEAGFAAKLAEPGLTDAEFRIAKGIYRPTKESEPEKSFVLRRGIALYGGFEGKEDEPEQRNPAAHETILSGKMSVGYCYHVVRFAGDADETTVLDGFIITNGRAEHASDLEKRRGGGIYNDGGSPLILNCIVIGNRATSSGGGMYSKNGKPVIRYCVFQSNTVTNGSGGALYSQGDVLALRECAFRGNEVSGGSGGAACFQSSFVMIDSCEFFGNMTTNNGGGALINHKGGLTMTNCTFSSNKTTGSYGGAVFSKQCDAVAVNCTFADNGASFGGAFYNESGESAVVNSVFKGNGNGEITAGGGTITLAKSVVPGWSGSVNIIAEDVWTDDPLLAPLADNGGPTRTHALAEGSPAIGAGFPSGERFVGGRTVNIPSIDQRGVSRPEGEGTATSIGAFEYAVPSMPDPEPTPPELPTPAAPPPTATPEPPPVPPPLSPTPEPDVPSAPDPFAPFPPLPLAPADGERGLSLTPVLLTASYSHPKGAPHTGTRWQIVFAGETSSGAAASNVVFERTSAGELTRLHVPEGVLRPMTAYVWRTRFLDALNGWSDWSPFRRFVTGEGAPVDDPVPASVAGGGCRSAVGGSAVMLLPLVLLFFRRA